METVKITKERLNLFVVCGKHYVSANNSKKSLLWINLDSLLELAIKKLKKVERQKELVNMKFCKKTASRLIEYDKQGRYQFTEEDRIKILSENDLIDQEEIDIPCMIVPKGDYPEKSLTYDVRNAFKGIVIPADEYAGIEDLKKFLEEENERVEEEEELIEE